MQKLKEAREFIENGNLTEEERMILEETGEVMKSPPLCGALLL